MSISTDMAGEWLAQVATQPDGNPDQRNARRAELIGAGAAIVRQLLAEIADLQDQLDAALDREERRETR